MRKYLLAALAAGTLATPAFAQTAPNTGLRVEGLVGYDRANVPGVESDGVTYGVGVGYDVDMGGMVAGIDAELTDSSVEECDNGVDVSNDELCAEFGRDIYVGGRLGARVGPNSIVYAKAGYTNARVNLNYEDGTASGAADYTLAEDLDGIRVGAGAEVGLGPNSFVKAEYRYSNYEQDVERHQVLAGFGFRF